MRYTVIANETGQFLTWPEQQDLPGGWQAVGPSGSKDECLAAITALTAPAAAPEAPADRGTRPFVAPRTPTEELLAAICADILSLEQVSVQDNFFDLGASSLHLALARKQIQTRLERELPVVKIFEHPSVEALAAYLDAASGPAPDDRTDERRDEGKRRLMHRQRQRAGAGDI